MGKRRSNKREQKKRWRHKHKPPPISERDPGRSTIGWKKRVWHDIHKLRADGLLKKYGVSFLGLKRGTSSAAKLVVDRIHDDLVRSSVPAPHDEMLRVCDQLYALVQSGFVQHCGVDLLPLLRCSNGLLASVVHDLLVLTFWPTYEAYQHPAHPHSHSRYTGLHLPDFLRSLSRIEYYRCTGCLPQESNTNSRHPFPCTTTVDRA